MTHDRGPARRSARRSSAGARPAMAGDRPVISARTGILLLNHRRRPRPAPQWPRAIAAMLAVSMVLGLAGTGLAAIGGFTFVSAFSAGLPEPTELEHLDFPQPTIVYDRTGTVELARYQQEGRRVVTFDELPPIILDATTTAEDRTFWENVGFDPGAILAAVAGNLQGTTDRGASTITQQLVRARLLPADAVAADADRYTRKVLEIIQSARVTDAYPGEDGKQRIITAYLNQIYYGHQAFGVAAAARVYFGITDLSKLSLAQAAQLAALPKAPSDFDLYQYAVADADGRLVVDPASAPVLRRNWVLQNIAGSRWTNPTEAEIQAAIDEPVVLAGEPDPNALAGHFTLQVRRQLEVLVGGPIQLETGGFKVITTLDWRAHQLAARWAYAGLVIPNLATADGDALLKSMGIPAEDQKWIKALRGKDLHDVALVAVDYRTGDVLAYQGSADFNGAAMASPKFSPQFDAAGDGARQPGSAFKPILYSTAFEAGVLTPGSLLLDITTQFDQKAKWSPRDADQLDRGPVLVRGALQYSLNIPAIRAYQRVGGNAVAAMMERLGIRTNGGTTFVLQAGLSAAIGTVEVKPIDLVNAYGAIADGGVTKPTRMILSVQAPDGSYAYQAPAPATSQAMSPQAAFLVTDILAGNTDPSQNPIWSAALQILNGPNGERRPAAVKTGTADDARDLATYGFTAPPADPGAPAYAAGVWIGNSDHSVADTEKPATSLTAAAPLWHAFMRDLTAGQPVADFVPPEGVVQATIDAWTGGQPGPWTRETRTEWFKVGTEPGAAGSPDTAGLLYSRSCGTWAVDPVKAELGPRGWLPDVQDWLERARRGTGVKGQYDSRTAYFWSRSGWGGPLMGPCATPAPTAPPSQEAGPGDSNGGGGNAPGGPGGGPPNGGGGNGNGNGNGRGTPATPGPSPSP